LFVDDRLRAPNVDDRVLRRGVNLRPDGSGDGIGPSGRSHTRFRSWKEDLFERSS
jgi:hypothetical protein